MEISTRTFWEDQKLDFLVVWWIDNLYERILSTVIFIITVFPKFYLFKDDILLCLLVAAFIAEMILQFRKVNAIRGNRPAIKCTLEYFLHFYAIV